MKLIFIIACLYMSLYSQAQEPFTKHRWSTNALIGLKNVTFSDKTSEIILDTLNQKRPYGYITEFLADNQFFSYNQGWCGNECRRQVKGTYKVMGNTIELFVISISYSKDCNGTPTQVVNTTLGLYTWEQKDTQLMLKPVQH
jgi:hypothetical protein